MKTAIIGKIRIADDKIAEARGVISTLVAATREEAGCISYGFAEDTEEAGLFRISEIWADGDALDAHMKAPHFAVWAAAAANFGITEREVYIFTVASERKL